MKVYESFDHTLLFLLFFVALSIPNIPTVRNLILLLSPVLCGLISHFYLSFLGSPNRNVSIHRSKIQQLPERNRVNSPNGRYSWKNCRTKSGKTAELELYRLS